MGAAISTNISNQIINSSTQIADTYVQTCTSTFSDTFNLSASNCTQNIGTINLDQTQTVNVACLQNDTTQASMQADIKAQILQQTIAAAQSIGLPSLTSAQSYEDFAQTTSQQISQAYTQSCVNQLSAAQNITCQAGANQTIKVINIESGQSAYTNCTQNDGSVNQAKQTLSAKLFQDTSAKEADTAVTFVIVGLIILTFVGIFFLYSLDGPIGWVVVGIFLLIVLAVIVYATVAFSDKLFPFNQKTAVQ